MTDASIENEDKVAERLRFFMDYYGRYHDHKETMAWVATAFYVAGAVYIAQGARGFVCASMNWQIVFSVLLALAGLLDFLFVRWQFNRRFEAHIRVRQCLLPLLKHHNETAAEHMSLGWDIGRQANPDRTRWYSYAAIGGILAAALAVVNAC